MSRVRSTERSGVCQLSIQGPMAVGIRRRERGRGGAEKVGSSNQGHTYGGSPFRLRKTRIRVWQRPRCRILSSPFPQAPSGLPVGIPVTGGRDEPT
jgi:hypothetical protein